MLFLGKCHDKWPSTRPKQKRWFANAVADALAHVGAEISKATPDLVAKVGHLEHVATWVILRTASVEALCEKFHN